MPVLIRMKNITKKFPEVTANDKINFELEEGEIHALLGENGAGKTTLMNILYGLYLPDGGEIYIQEQRVKISSPRDAIKLKIGMVHQHFKLVSSHTAVENIVQGLSWASFFFPERKVKKKIRELSETYGLKVEPDAPIWQLSAGEQQRVEIIKALLREVKVLILDEPTTMLTPAETKELFSLLRRTAKEGCSVVFITHKLNEVMTVSDRVTVLRNGKKVATLKVSQVDKQELTQMMIGERAPSPLKRKSVEKGEVVLKVKNLSALNDKNSPALKNISFAVHQGEILGIAGVAGNGQRELIEVITGLRKAFKGKVVMRGEEITNRSSRQISDRGVAHIPEDRVRIGVVPELNVMKNLILKTYRRPPFCQGLFLNLRFIHQHAGELIAKYRIITPGQDTPVSQLSGGNIQKLILARELSQQPDLIIASHPTYGLDLKTTQQIRSTLLKQREKGTAILLVSEDLEEVMSLSDRIGVMFEGEIRGLKEAQELTIKEIGSMMTGSKEPQQ